MQRHFEYTDADGKRWSAMQNYVGLDRREANRQLSHLATVNGWKEVEVFKESMPAHEIRQRINKIQEANGNPLLYEDHELRPAETRKTIILLDHEDQSRVEVVQPTSPAQVVSPGQPVLPLTPIKDHAAPSVRPIEPPPKVDTVTSNAPAPSNVQTIQSNVPVGGAQG